MAGRALVRRMSHYATLGVSQRATQRDIKTVSWPAVLVRLRFVRQLSTSLLADNPLQAYIKLCKELHPDVYATKSAVEQQKAHAKFVSVNGAFKVLSDPGLRDQYDVSLARGYASQWPGSSSGFSSPPPQPGQSSG